MLTITPSYEAIHFYEDSTDYFVECDINHDDISTSHVTASAMLSLEDRTVYVAQNVTIDPYCLTPDYRPYVAGSLAEQQYVKYLFVQSRKQAHLLLKLNFPKTAELMSKLKYFKWPSGLRGEGSITQEGDSSTYKVYRRSLDTYSGAPIVSKYGYYTPWSKPSNCNWLSEKREIINEEVFMVVSDMAVV